MHKNMKTEIGNERREKEIGRRERMKEREGGRGGKTSPTCITPTDLLPNVVLWSLTQKSTVLVELTVCNKH